MIGSCGHKVFIARPIMMPSTNWAATYSRYERAYSSTPSQWWHTNSVKKSTNENKTRFSPHGYVLDNAIVSRSSRPSIMRKGNHYHIIFIEQRHKHKKIPTSSCENELFRGKRFLAGTSIFKSILTLLLHLHNDHEPWHTTTRLTSLKIQWVISSRSCSTELCGKVHQFDSDQIFSEINEWDWES